MSGVVELHHVVDGPVDAPVLVLAGSLGSTLEMWRPQVAALADSYRIVRLDHRGHGGSPVPPGPYRMADLAGDVLALLDRLELSTVAWCGLSLGGMVGMYLGSTAPERLTSLTLCCTTAYFPDPAPWVDRIAAVTAGGTEPIADAVVARWFTPDWAAAHPDQVKECRDMVANTADSGYLASCQAIQAWDHRDQLPSLPVPTLIIGGADDLSTPIDPHSRTLVENIPGARLEVVPGAHLATIEEPDRTSALIGAHAAN